MEVLFTTHVYKFGGKFFLQKDGGPIGLRGTCAIARMVMCLWDGKWKTVLSLNNILIYLYKRYMDDGRVCLPGIKAGWRWAEGELKYKEEWKNQDQTVSPTERTRRVLAGSMEGVIKCLTFTTETGEDFQDSCLPTLDLNLWVSGNQVLFKYYEKPTTTNVTVQRASAMEENSKKKILANDQIRRLLNTHEKAGKVAQEIALDQYAQKLMNSGYPREETIRIIVAGLKGFERKVSNCKKAGKKIYRTSKESSASRARKKLLGNANWFRTSRRKENEDNPSRSGTKKAGKIGKELKTRTVLFVEHTPGGALAKKLREVLSSIEHILGFRIRVVERAGTPLGRLFPLTQLWEGAQCGREGCVTCTQGGGGEITPMYQKERHIPEHLPQMQPWGRRWQEGTSSIPVPFHLHWRVI